MVLCFKLNRVPFSSPGCWLVLAVLHSHRSRPPCLAGISLRAPGALPCLMPCPTPHSACFGISDWAQPGAECRSVPASAPTYTCEMPPSGSKNSCRKTCSETSLSSSDAEGFQGASLSTTAQAAEPLPPQLLSPKASAPRLQARTGVTRLPFEEVATSPGVEDSGCTCHGAS